MSLSQIPLNPGVYVDDTPLKAKGFFVAADKIRFVRGLPQVMGGWELLTATQLSGICRGLHSWMDANLVKWVAVGTHTNLYGITDSIVYDFTPVVARGPLTNPFTTTLALTTVSVAHTAHGRNQGDGVNFSNASAVNGITVNGTYAITSVTDANNYVITTTQTASGSGSGGGTVYCKYFLSIGLENDIGALGYGTALYSTGSTYSSPGTGEIFPRSWSIYNLGPNLIASPRGGKMYEIAPIATATELTTNGSFTGSATSWTLGAGWAYGSNNIVATSATAFVTQSSLVTAPNSFNLVSVDVTTYVAGSLSVTLGADTVISGIAATGRYYGTDFTTGISTVQLSGLNACMTVDNVSVTQLTTAEVIPNAPTQNTVVIVTAEGFVMTGGTIAAASGNFDPLHLRWSDIGSVSKSEQTWTPSSTNLSGFVTLRAGSRIVGMKLSTNEILVWTDKALYAGTYVNNSSLVYSFRLVGMNCGLIGPNAAAVLGGVAYWMDTTGQVWAYSGGAPTQIKSTMSKDMFDNLSLVQQDKIYASAISQFSEVIWLYPDKRDGNECSRYSLFCTSEAVAPPQGTNPGAFVGCFAPGTFDRTAMIDSSIGLPYPIAVSSTGYVYFHEKGNTANGGALSWSLETGSINIGDGSTLWRVKSFIPDFAGFVGGATMTAFGYKYPQSTPTTTGPYAFTSMSEKIDILSSPPIGRETAFLFEGNSSPAFMRTGVLTMDIEDTGMAF